MSHPTAAISTRAALLGLLLLFAAGCHSLDPPPSATIEAHPLLPVDKMVDTGMEKTFTLRHDWSHGAWVIKSGASITFRPDGIGHFSAVAYCTTDVGTDEIRFQSIQYGADGNVLFAFPDNPVGYPLHIRRAAKDYPYDVNFGFDPRHFASIDEAHFFARMRIHGVDPVALPEKK